MSADPWDDLRLKIDAIPVAKVAKTEERATAEEMVLDLWRKLEHAAGVYDGFMAVCRAPNVTILGGHDFPGITPDQRRSLARESAQWVMRKRAELAQSVDAITEFCHGLRQRKVGRPRGKPTWGADLKLAVSARKIQLLSEKPLRPTPAISLAAEQANRMFRNEQEKSALIKRVLELFNGRVGDWIDRQAKAEIGSGEK